MKAVVALALAGALLLPGVAFAGAATDAALGLGAFAVFNQIVSGVGVFGRAAPEVVYQPAPPVVYQPPPPPPVVYVPAPPPTVVYQAPPPVIYQPAPPVVIYRSYPAYYRGWRHHHRHHDDDDD